MTDGTTGFQVAPITEEDMFKVKDILQRAADAIVGMSQLSHDVEGLRKTVAELQADTDKLRSQNNALDEALNYSRSERDRQASELNNVKAELASAHNEASSLKFEHDKLDLDLGQAHIDLDLTRRDRDDAQLRVMELEDKLAAAQAKLDKVAELHRALFPPETVIVPIAGSTAVNPAMDYSTHESTPEPASTPQPFRTYLGNEWKPGAFWDSVFGEYYIEN